MKRAILLLLAAACHQGAGAADVLPAYLTGTWGTAASLYEGTTGQSQLHLQADGFGAMAGSTPPAIRMDGLDDGKPAPRAIIGFPVRATLDGEALTVQPFLPGQPLPPALPCHYDAATPALTCTGPDGKPMVLQHVGAVVPDEVAAMIKTVRAQAAPTD